MRKWIRRILLALVVLVGLAALGYVFREPLLRATANAWVVNQPTAKADVIVLLGGGPETRPQACAQLWQQHIAPKILVMNPKQSPSVDLGLRRSDTELTRDILLRTNVIDEAIVIAPDRVSSTIEEAKAVRSWAATNNIHTVVIPTDEFHTRRVRWVFEKILKPEHINVSVIAVPVREYSRTNWWQHEEGLIGFQNELVKYAFYRLRY